ncbi:MAG: MBL fold metallo-hydrolase [Victivallaceae bacterium]|nr:MBL fold metallo-hydrolase [Victivallaceae bacterium]
MDLLLTVAVDNRAAETLTAEHGLSLCLQNDAGTTWFDTGSGTALEKNAAVLGLSAMHCDRLILSHGHNDHTGGIPFFPAGTTVFCGKDPAAPCYSRHADGTVHALTIPDAGLRRLRECRVREVAAFTRIAPGMYASGAIERSFPVVSGGHFFSDAACTLPNPVPEEIFLYLADGILITGCCHAGLQNCVACLRRNLPDAPLHTVIGGLHWCDLTEENLQETARFLETLKLRRLILLHCTGASSAEFMRRRFHGVVSAGRAGDRYRL